MRTANKYGGELLMVFVMEQHMYLNILKESFPFCGQKLCLVKTFIFAKITTLSIMLTMCGHGYLIIVHILCTHLPSVQT